MPLFRLNTLENLKISLTLSSLTLSVSSLSLICLLALMADQKKISHCQRNHPSLSQSNYKPGYFLPSAKHIADWYCMTSFSCFFHPKITVKSTLILQWNCLGNFSKTLPLKLSLWKTSLWLQFEIKSPNRQSVWTMRWKSSCTSNGKVNGIAAVTVNQTYTLLHQSAGSLNVVFGLFNISLTPRHDHMSDVSVITWKQVIDMFILSLDQRGINTQHQW